MKARPILMSAPMVRALLEGQKTQTRRIVQTRKWNRELINLAEFYNKEDFDPEDAFFSGSPNDPNSWGWPHIIEYDPVTLSDMVDFGTVPYGKVGDFLWVKETFKPHNPHAGRTRPSDAIYRADYVHSDGPGPWTSSLFMPRSASRLTLEITNIRAQRLHDISEEECWAEGIDAVDGMFDLAIPAMAKKLGISYEDAKPTYACLWESINGAGSWDLNPWVWAITFIVRQQNIDDRLLN